MSHRGSSHTVVVTGSDHLTARDPNARCDKCGLLGTIALFEHDKPPRQIERYCDTCWPARRDALEAAGIHGWLGSALMALRRRVRRDGRAGNRRQSRAREAHSRTRRRAPRAIASDGHRDSSACDRIRWTNAEPCCRVHRATPILSGLALFCVSRAARRRCDSMPERASSLKVTPATSARVHRACTANAPRTFCGRPMMYRGAGLRVRRHDADHFASV